MAVSLVRGRRKTLGSFALNRTPAIESVGIAPTPTSSSGAVAEKAALNETLVAVLAALLAALLIYAITVITKRCRAPRLVLQYEPSRTGRNREEQLGSSDSRLAPRRPADL